ncbi:flagellar biosynthetic protein FliQ (plasmid) [Rhizobium leguminosarum]|nr:MULTISPECIES: flagellar biosynthetic protein FliQ [Rhizobium]MBY5378380.1 flagellar biosynthetic protein FliQ [Rhizobium leguminosarum]TBF35128.1 flagellar biosynthetic protein FliQ [Rhizobium leguminosarum]TBF87972.1 flagellar biosynthetic protein FliQ [Rhizobium leguminosarum]WSH48669.1 flagellar biosynthetic protein FliQ [Rhizobium johnstonii]
MGQEIFLNEMNAALITVLIVSAPALCVAIVIGVAVGLIQALTQIQDQTLPQAVKLVGVMLVLIFIGPLLAVQVGALASHSLDSFASLTR